MRRFSSLLGLVASLLMAIGPVTVFSQELDISRESPYTLSTHDRIHWGVTVGINGSIPNFRPEVTPPFTKSAGVGWMAAARALVKISPKSYGLLQLGYSRAVSQFGYDTLENKLKMDFAELSLRFCQKYRFKKVSDIFVGAGPNIKYWMNASGTMKSASLSTDYPAVINGTPDGSATMYLSHVNRWLFGAEVSVGITTPLFTGHKLMIEVNTAYMLTPLGTDDAYSTFNNPSFTTQFQQQQLDQQLLTITASVSYLFGYNPVANRLGKSTKEKNAHKRDPRKQKKDKAYLNTRLKKPKK